MVAALIVAGSLSSWSAGAQPSNADAARLLYDDAMELMSRAEKQRADGADAQQVRKLVNEACGKFEAAREQMSGLGITINLARCREQQGRTATAWFLYKDALVLHKRAAAQGEKKSGRLAFLEGRIAALEPELAYLRIEIDKAHQIKDMQVHYGDVELNPALWGSDVPVDPGEHQLRISAPGHEPAVTKLSISARDKKGFSVPPLKALTGPQPDGPERPKVQPEPGLSGGQIAALITGGVGVAALGVGAVFGGLATSEWSRAQKLCPESPCSDVEGATLDDDARLSGNVSTGLLAGGGALLGGAVILWFLTAPSDAEPADVSARLLPVFSSDSAGIVVTGSF